MIIKMNSKVKALWVKALRSGEYEQGKGSLVTTSLSSTDPIKHCCLGVLQDLYHKDQNQDFPSHHSTLLSLSGRALYWAGISTTPCVPKQNHIIRHTLSCDHDIQHVLSAANDQGVSFNKIADWIEKHL